MLSPHSDAAIILFNSRDYEALDADALPAETVGTIALGRED